MPKLWRSLLGRPEERADPALSMDDWLQMMSFQGTNYALTGTTASADTESIENSFVGYINGLYKSNGIVFACMEARRSVFSEARFQFQKIKNGRPGDLFGSQALKLLEYPWPNGTTGELLSRAVQDVDLTGNHYVAREAGRLRRLRPDWVQIILSSPPDRAVESDVMGYIYWPGGINNSPDAARIYDIREVAHWSPIPDPEAQYRGMSWLTPVLREIQADKQATEHKAKFYANAATPKLAVSLKDTVTKQQFSDFMEAFEASNGGIENAYKTIYLGGGADVSIVGANMQQIDFKAVQGAGETRIAAAAGVPSVVVGFSEGMQGSSLNSGNYKSAKESFGDRTLRPLWRSVAASYQALVDLPAQNGTVRLWYDARDIAFLRTDLLEAAKIQTEQASNIVKLITVGFKPDTARDAVVSGDLMVLVHSGLTSVQLIPPGQTTDGAAPVPALPEPPADGVPKGIKVSPPKEVPPKRNAGARHGSKADAGYYVYHPGSAAKSGELVENGSRMDKNDPLAYYRLNSDDDDQIESDEELFSNYSADGWSDPVTNYLRTGESDVDELYSNEEMDEMTAAMDRIAARHVLSASIPLYRVAPRSVYGDRADGTVVTDKAPTSTSVYGAVAAKYKTQDTDVTIRIDMPAGAHMIPHHHMNPYGSAKGEVIVPRNTPLRKVREDGDVIVYEPVF